jgi:hypothetical protein
MKLQCFNEGESSYPEYDYWLHEAYWIHLPFHVLYCYSEPIILLMNYNVYPYPDIIPKFLYEFINPMVRAIERRFKSFPDLNTDFLMDPNNKNHHASALKKVEGEMRRIYSILGRALESKDLSHTTKEFKIDKYKTTEYHIKPKDFISWAKSNGFMIPEPFLVLLEEIPPDEALLNNLPEKVLLEEKSPVETLLNTPPEKVPLEEIFPEDIPPYLDPEHEKFAPELTIAINAWRVIHSKSGVIKDNRSHIKQIKKWLSDKYPELSEEATDRIAKVINIHSRKKGGVIKI